MIFPCCRRVCRSCVDIREGLLIKKAEKKLEVSFDIRTLKASKSELKELQYLLLDDSYLRQLLRLSRWRRLSVQRRE